MSSALLTSRPERNGVKIAAAIGADELTGLIQTFNQVSTQLQATHTALHDEVARLKGELAETNAQLRRSQALAALGEMAAGIAHEVRNPLGSIQLYAQVLNDELTDRPQQRELCTKIGRAVEHLDAIVRDVLSFARDMKLRRRRVDVASLFERTVESVSAILIGSGVTVHVQRVSSSLSLDADETLLIQALCNLVRNAIEAIAESGARAGTITLSAERRTRRDADRRRLDWICLAVEDSGPGIPPDVVERMFNPFFTTRKTGTGLGLAIVHRIIDAHGGLIGVGPGHDGLGARLELCLPIEVVMKKPTSNPSTIRQNRTGALPRHSAMEPTE